MDSAKEFAVPVDGDIVGFLQGGNEEIDITLAGILHAEVIDDETEGKWPSFVSEETGGVRCCDKICLLKMAN